MATTMMISSTRTPAFSPTYVPPPVDISPLMVRPHRHRNRNRNRKRVSFLAETHIRYTIHRNDYSASERRRTWLTMDELRYMKKSCQRLALELSEPSGGNTNIPATRNATALIHNNNNTKEDDDDRCLRGLEGRTRQGISKRKRVRNAARDAVLWEQGLQRKWGISIDGFSNEKILADCYYEFTEFSQIEAHMVGLRDASEALLGNSASTAAATTPRNATHRKTTAAAGLSSTPTTSLPTPCHNINDNHDDNHGLATTTKATIGGGSRLAGSKPCPDPPGWNAGRNLSGSSSGSSINSSSSSNSNSNHQTRNNLRSLSQLTSTRRLLTDAFFQV